MSLRDFGDEFTWGVATAAYQIEGSPEADGKGPSIWDTFSHRPGTVADGSTGDIATDSYRRFPEDVALVGAMGFDAYRFSLSWPRIQPDGRTVNRKGLDHYQRVVDSCLGAGVEPWVTLYHWDLPQALEDRGGWTDRDIVEVFADYVGLVGQVLGDRVRHWMIFNEPLSFTMLGYMLGEHAPGRRGLNNYLPAMHHVNLATAHGVRAMRAADPDGIVGSTHYLTAPIGTGPGPLLAQRAERAAEALLNRSFLEPGLGLGYPVQDAPILRMMRRYMRDGDVEACRTDLDFLGVQYYTRMRAPFRPIPGLWTIPVMGDDPDIERTSLGWEIRPEGLGMVLDMVHAYDRYPRIVVTEGGASFDDVLAGGRVHDDLRIAYYESHVAQVRAAVDRGVPVDGYFCWSLMDNFEWAEGLRARFGLVHVDFQTQHRTIKDSGYWFAGQLGGMAVPPRP
ncbi:MAG TPA: GH1 family beta-glucosidase [Actinomycetota bacterium]|nr:GH1 family beta-glucosidase [Actinomycetota bacterium]